MYLPPERQAEARAWARLGIHSDTDPWKIELPETSGDWDVDILAGEELAEAFVEFLDEVRLHDYLPQLIQKFVERSIWDALSIGFSNRLGELLVELLVARGRS